MQPSITIRPFNITGASLAEYTSLNRHINLLRKERLPDDPPILLEETIQELKNIPSYLELLIWCAWDSSEIIAEGSTQLLHIEENQHLAQFDISVQPAYRGQGVARQLLDMITQTVQADHRRLLIAKTYDRIPAGEAFMTRLGAQRGLEGHVNQLRMAELDHNLIEEWLKLSQSRAAEFELGLWEGAYPEEQIAAVAQLYELTNQQPMGDLEVEDMQITPEHIRQIEQLLSARGEQRWTFYIIEKATGKFAGYTETTWKPSRPEILSQDMTGVFPEYRNRGLGRWMKAAMLDKVLKERPEVKYVRTGNADANAAMLKINTELGFKPYMANTLWQVEIDRVSAYLNESK